MIHFHFLLPLFTVVVESLERKRAPYPNLDAIYFVSATEESVKLMIDDFAKGKPPYAAAHIFFTSGSFFSLPFVREKKHKKKKLVTQYMCYRQISERSATFNHICLHSIP